MSSGNSQPWNINTKHITNLLDLKVTLHCLLFARVKHRHKEIDTFFKAVELRDFGIIVTIKQNAH